MFTVTNLTGFGGSGPSTAVQIDRTSGTNIGNMTSGGGLAAAFDGTTNQAGANCAIRGSSNSGYVGKTLDSSEIIYKALIYSSSTAGFVGSTNPTVTLTLYAKQGGAPSSGTDGTSLGSTSFTDTGGTGTNTKEIFSNDITTYWDHVWVRISFSGPTDNVLCAEFEPFALR